MTYRVTQTTTWHVDPVPFATWLQDVLDPNVVYNKFPECSGSSISTIVEEAMNVEFNVLEGFLSQNDYTVDEKAILITDWESENDYINSRKVNDISIDSTPGNITCNTSSVTIVGNNTYFSSNLSVNEYVSTFDPSSNTVIDIGQIASIESDTSLTLKSNALLNATNYPYSKLTKLAFIQQLYYDAYPSTTETTYANV